MNLPAKAALPPLNQSQLKETARAHRSALPERVLQFGEGNFLRAFVDWMVDRLNEKGSFSGSVVVVQPISEGLGELLNEQDGLYTVLLRGVESGQVTETTHLIQSVSRVINPYQDHESYIRTAENPELRYVVSNTTEAGIAVSDADDFSLTPSPSFPGKLTQWLYHRYVHFEGATDKGVVLLPCELIERNGTKLKEVVLALASKFDLPAEFSTWLESACVFASTLVDRIVTGYPRDEAASICSKLGYVDKLLVTGELYHCWVIECAVPLESELPLQTAGLNVIWTDDAAPYRERKVRILNGAHTAMTLVGLVAGFQTVGDCMKHKAMRQFVENLLDEEICPTLLGDKDDNARFSASVLERFENPFVRHELSSIALNSVSKYKARLLGAFRDTLSARGNLPERLCLALAALIVLYGGKAPGVMFEPKDEERALSSIRNAWEREGSAQLSAVVASILSDAALFGEDLTFLHADLVGRVAYFVGELCAGNVEVHLG